MAKRSIRILVVEDNEPTAYLLGVAFRDKAARVSWNLSFARDGEEALDCLFQRGNHSSSPLPELVLLDWNLPNVSGREVLQRLKASHALRTIPVLVFSASTEDADVQTAYSTHANGFIPKPSDFGQLHEIIDAIERFWVNTVKLHPLPHQ